MPTNYNVRSLGAQATNFQFVAGTSSSIAQNPTGTDTETAITLGTPFANGEITLAANGEWTFTPGIGNTGVYYFQFDLLYSRTGGSGVSHMYTRLKTDGFDNPLFTWGPHYLAAADDSKFLSLGVIVPAVEGSTGQLFMWRDSDGDDSGGLQLNEPAFLGGATPVANVRMIITKLLSYAT